MKSIVYLNNAYVSLRKQLFFLWCGSVIVLLWLFAFILPTCNLKIGDFFFGQYPAYYNVDVAQFFYQQAANPVIGTPPMYAHYQLSRTYFIQGDLIRSANEAKRELELYPDNVRTYYILGLTYGYMDLSESAISSFRSFIQYYPDSWAARNDLAWLQFRYGDSAGALETIMPVSDVLNPWVQNTYGVMLLNTNQAEAAYQAFFVALENARLLSDEGWGAAYPGNNPLIYPVGRMAMLQTIESNMDLAKEQIALTPK